MQIQSQACIECVNVHNIFPCSQGVCVVHNEMST